MAQMTFVQAVSLQRESDGNEQDCSDIRWEFNGVTCCMVLIELYVLRHTGYKQT